MGAGEEETLEAQKKAVTTGQELGGTGKGSQCKEHWIENEKT